MLLRHENVQIEVHLPQNWRIVNILTIADVSQRLVFDKGFMLVKGLMSDQGLMFDVCFKWLMFDKGLIFDKRLIFNNGLY